jgi:hypothetical protein
MEVDCIEESGTGFFIGKSLELTNEKSTVVTFRHGLGRLPIITQLQFSPDAFFDSVSIVQWNWDGGWSGNPVTMSVDSRAVYVAIFHGAPLHGIWNPAVMAPGEWTRYTKGYFRVIVA